MIQNLLYEGYSKRSLRSKSKRRARREAHGRGLSGRGRSLAAFAVYLNDFKYLKNFLKLNLAVAYVSRHKEKAILWP